jgi:N-acetylglucosaminyldiphosphoundecaprenol N-acetyl-beta-D-mannosaminyltransferase
MQMSQEQLKILGVRIDTVPVEQTSETIIQLSREGHHYVCAANVHMIMESHDDARFRDLVNSATIVVPDGKPIVWALRRLGAKRVERITGYSLTLQVLEKARKNGISVGFYGGDEKILDLMVRRVQKDHPGLRIAYAFSPPFRTLSDNEDQTIVENLVQSGVKILFVGLGCPKQEQWMASHKDQIPAVMIGVGAVFEFLAGTKARAPKVLQEMGLEWLFRLFLEPRRLWRRYLVENPRFIAKFSSQLLGFGKD